MIKNCEVCGDFCRKESTRMYEEIYVCDSCGLKYPVGKKTVYGTDRRILRVVEYDEDHRVVDSTEVHETRNPVKTPLNP